MASPMLEGRAINPRDKAHFTLHISDRISEPDSSRSRYSGVKYNHKPPQTRSARRTTLAPTSGDRYTLTLKDSDSKSRPNDDVFTFTGQKTSPSATKNSYILLFDPGSQKATLEPLDTTFTFNLTTQNQKDISSTYPKLQSQKSRGRAATDSQAADDLLDDTTRDRQDDLGDEPDSANPFDFRHFLHKDSSKKGDESELDMGLSPDYRTGTGSAMTTPVLPAHRKPAPKPAPAPRLKKRKSPEPASALVARKPAGKKPPAQSQTPTVRLERKASTRVADTKPAARKSGKASTTAPAASKIKSAEIVHSSDESSDEDPVPLASSPARIHSSPTSSPEPARRPAHQPSPSPSPQPSSPSSDNDEDMNPHSTLEIEDPSGSHAPQPRRTQALSSLGLGQTLGLGALSHLRSPSAGPISLASAANSVEGSPNPDFHRQRGRGRADQDVIDLGSLGDADADADGSDDSEDEGVYRGVEDRDVEPMDLGPPATAATRGAGVEDAGAEEDEGEDDPLYKEMMEGLAGDSSEESEEE